MSSVVFYSNQIKHPKPLLAKSIFFFLLAFIAFFFLYHFCFSHDNFWAKFLYLWLNIDLLRDPKIFFIFFIEVFQFATFSLCFFIFVVYGIINFRSLCSSGFFDSLNGKIGPIRDAKVSIIELLKEGKIKRSNASYLKEKGLITSLVFGNWADIVCNKYKFLVVLFSSFSKNIMLIMLTSFFLFGFAIICSYMLISLEESQFDIAQKLPYGSYIYQIIYQYKNHDLFDAFFAYEPIFYLIAILNLYLVIFSTRSIFINFFVYRSEKNVQYDDFRHLFNSINISQEVFHDKESIHKVYSRPEPVNHSNQSFEYLFETHPRALSSLNTLFYMPHICLLFSIIFFSVFCILLSFSPSFYQIPSSFGLFWQSCFILLYPWFALKNYQIYKYYCDNIIFYSDIIYILGLPINTSSPKPTYKISVFASRILTESETLKQCSSIISFDDILKSDRVIINTLPCHFLKDKIDLFLSKIHDG